MAVSYKMKTSNSRESGLLSNRGKLRFQGLFQFMN